MGNCSNFSADAVGAGDSCGVDPIKMCRAMCVSQSDPLHCSYYIPWRVGHFREPGSAVDLRVNLVGPPSGWYFCCRGVPFLLPALNMVFFYSLEVFRIVEWVVVWRS